MDMKRLFLTIISLLTLTALPAQTFDAGAVLEKTSQVYAGWGGVHVKFTMHVFYEKNGVSENSEGTIQMKKNKFVLTTPDMTTWFDGTTQWTYMPHSDEVNIITPSGDDLRILNPMMLLQDYKKDYNVSPTGESTSVNAKPAFDITFTPKKKDAIEKIDIQIEKNTSLPAKLVIFMRNQIRITVIINELKAGNLSDEFFVFPKTSYPDVTVIDLR